MMSTGPKLNKEQREQIKRWVAEGHDDYLYIKQRLIELGWPMIRRQAVHFYKKRYSSQQKCPKCGQVVPQPHSKLQPSKTT
jgi:DNA repair exonuclease SbcCD ATPase subunit